jgi:uncharacterized protein YndB with AHSA1/START domain
MSNLTVSLDVPNEIRLTRVFDAPRRLVIQAMTKPELMKRWMGGKRATVPSIENDVRVGGSYRYRYRNNRDGSEFTMSGVFREITDDRIVMTQVFNDMPGDPAVVTTTFVEQAGKTTMTVAIAFPTPEIRDMVVATGMAQGAGESYDELANLVASL